MTATAQKPPKNSNGKSSPLPPAADPVADPEKLILLADIDDDGRNRDLTGKDERQKIERLARTIAEHGLLSPILVYRTDNGRYQHGYGARRRAAASLLGWKEIPAKIRPLPADRAEIEAVRALENLERVDLTPVEEALEAARLVEACNGDVTRAAAKLGRLETWIKDRCYLQRLCNEVKDLLSAGRINLGQARLISKLGDAERQIYIAEDIALDEDLAGRIRTIEEVQRSVEMELHSLKVVPWKLELPMVLGKDLRLPACIGCPDNSATDPVLFDLDAGFQSAAGFCGNPGCFEQKQKAIDAAKAKTIATIKKKDLETDIETVRDLSPDYAKPESVQRAAKKELGEDPEKKPGKNGQGKLKPQSDNERRNLALRAYVRDFYDWRRNCCRAIEKAVEKNPRHWIGWLLLLNLKIMDKYEYHINDYRDNETRPPVPKLSSPEMATAISLADDGDESSWLKLATQDKASNNAGIDSAAPEIITRIAEAFEVTIKAEPLFDDFLPEDLRPKKSSAASPEHGRGASSADAATGIRKPSGTKAAASSTAAAAISSSTKKNGKKPRGGGVVKGKKKITHAIDINDERLEHTVAAFPDDFPDEVRA